MEERQATNSANFNSNKRNKTGSIELKRLTQSENKSNSFSVLDPATRKVTGA